MGKSLKVTVMYDALEDRVQAERKARGEKCPPLVSELLEGVLREAGHEVNKLSVGGTREAVAQLADEDGDLVFNVCESFNGRDASEHHAAALLEMCGKRFTGAGSNGLMLAGDKALTKKLLRFHGISTPRFSVMHAGEADHLEDLGFPMFVKPSNADASIGIDHRSVVHNVKELMERISYIQTEFGAPALIEEYVEGREIYVGVLGGERVEALPLVEWDFSRVPDGTPRIASAEAKWDPDSPRYKDAPEVVVDDLPPHVVKALQHAAVEAFRALQLRDYGRVDMRVRRRRPEVSANGDRPSLIDDWEFYVIEVNPNAHLALDSELPLAAKAHGLDYRQLIERIVASAMSRPRI
ncbi:MAG: D-alanine--D-alanine ligase [Polyangiales bacterium]